MAALLLAVGVALYCPGEGEIYDIAIFREARLGLPVIDDICLPVMPPEVLTWGSPEEIIAAAEQYANQTSEALLNTWVMPPEHDGAPRSCAAPPGCRYSYCREFDLDGNGQPEEFILQNGTLTVRSGPDVTWQSPQEWWVDYFFLGDANNDGTPELNLLVWKEGSFGPRKPFWVEKDDPIVKNHLFIFKLEEGTFRAVWQSSNLDRPNYHAVLVDLDGDGENELIAAEGSYSDPAAREVTCWKWNGWGFSFVNALENRK